MVLINGQPGSLIDISDRGLQYGDGLFETIAFRNGKLEYLDAHLARLAKGCSRLAVSNLDIATLRQELSLVTADTVTDCVVKVIVTRGQGGRGYKFTEDLTPTRIISTSALPDYPVENNNGVQVYLCQYRLAHNPTLAGIKHLNRLDQVLARNEWQDDAIKEGFMLDQQNHLIEGTMSNVFLIKDAVLYTPELNRVGIEGVMRAQVLSLAKQLGISCYEQTLTVDDLYAADEVFITNSLIGIWPVIQMEEKSWAHGLYTRQIQTALAQVVD